MKKILMAAIATLLVLTFSTQTFAAEGGQYKAEMTKSANETLKEAHKNFKNGSLKLDKLKAFEVSASDSDLKQVVVGLASYETVRDNIFGFTHKEAVFYDPANKKMLTLTDVAPFENVNEYKDSMKSETGKFMHFGVILPLLALILLVPIYFMTVWSKRQYSTQEWAVPNNVYNNQQSFN